MCVVVFVCECVCVVVCVVVCVAVVWVCTVVGGRVRWGSCGRCVVSKNKNPTLRMWGAMIRNVMYA